MAFISLAHIAHTLKGSIHQPADASHDSDRCVVVDRISHDGRTITPSTLFVPRCHGTWTELDLVNQALSSGATAIVTSLAPSPTWDATIIRVPDIHACLAPLYALFYPKQPDHIVAVTGTDGKTSVSFFLHQLWTMTGMPSASIGTLGLYRSDASGHDPAFSGLTTPTQPLLSTTLHDCCAQGINHVALETSSHGLAQRRIDPVRPSVGVFTSFSQEHMDYHPSMDAYFDAKWTLFTENVQQSGHALLSTGLPDIQCKGQSLSHLNVIYYGPSTQKVPGANNATFDIVDHTDKGLVVRFAIGTRSWTTTVPVIGAFQVENILAALVAFDCTQGTIDHIIPLLPTLPNVPGRLQRLSNKGKTVFVDYAHTPNALKKALTTLRPHVKGRLVLVFGCGGDRDSSKRILMGQVAHQWADHVIITDDNPRYEDPASIRSMIQQGCPKGQSMACRATSIAYAIGLLTTDDVLIVAGRGHETLQSYKGMMIPLSDIATVAEHLGLASPPDMSVPAA